MWQLGEPGGNSVRYVYEQNPQLQPLASGNLLQSLRRAAADLKLPDDECEPALNLAECLRLSNLLPHLRQYPPELKWFASPLKHVEQLAGGPGKTGYTCGLWTAREKLVLLALNLVCQNHKLSVRLFGTVSGRTIDAASRQLYGMTVMIPKKGG